MSLLQPKAVADGSGPSITCKRLYWEGDLFGNNNYQGGNNNGDFYTASQFGMAGITFISVNDRSNSGNYIPAALYPANSSNSAELYAPASNNVSIRWFAANGTEVANNSNLAAEIVRVQIFGL